MQAHLAGYCSQDQQRLSCKRLLGATGSVDFSDSDEEDENGASTSNGHDEGLSSFPVDSWEDSWDDSDAPVSQEVRFLLNCKPYNPWWRKAAACAMQQHPVPR